MASREQFALLGDFVRKKVDHLRQDILGGDVSLSPYKIDDQSACTYCPYKESCGFDRRLPGYGFRNLRKISRNDIWRQMEDEVHGS